MDKILVGLKRVVDYNVRVRVRERGEAGEVIVASIGGADAQQQLRTGLAMGADRAILVTTDEPADPLTAARTLLALVEKENADLVILGKQAIDDDNSQTGQMLAALWERPQATFASRLEFSGDVARVTREVDAGLELIEVDLPAVVTCDLRLNEPRYVKLPDIMKAKQKPLDTMTLADLGVERSGGLKASSFEPPAEREKGVMVDDVAGLVAALKDKGLL